jgi:hypothetical protein
MGCDRKESKSWRRGELLGGRAEEAQIYVIYKDFS